MAIGGCPGLPGGFASESFCASTIRRRCDGLVALHVAVPRFFTTPVMRTRPVAGPVFEISVISISAAGSAQAMEAGADEPSAASAPQPKAASIAGQNPEEVNRYSRFF